MLPSLRIPQKFRISGSLVVILVVFLLTAILVKVEMAPLPFFTLTMIKIVCINCEFPHTHTHTLGCGCWIPTRAGGYRYSNICLCGLNSIFMEYLGCSSTILPFACWCFIAASLAVDLLIL